jgi:hypothetical protein
VEPPPAFFFTTVPTVENIEPTDESHTYRLTLREASGRADTFVMTVVEGDIPLVTWDRDLSYWWPGDAASLRAVFNAVFDAHRRRHR